MSATLTSARLRLPALAAPTACGLCLVVGATYVAVEDPSAGGAFVPCPFRTLTGWWCPGCGLTRATHHLFRGDVSQALRYNLFVVAILVVLAATWLAWSLHAAGCSIRWATRVPVWAQVLAGGVLTTFALVRNLPGVDGLRG